MESDSSKKKPRYLLREWYVTTRDVHTNKVRGDLTYLTLGANGNELSFFPLIHLQLTVTQPLGDFFKTSFKLWTRAGKFMEILEL